MIISIDFLSVDQMRQVKPSLDTVVVSILDESERAQRPRLAGFGGALTLTFEDCSEEPGESWPEQMDDVQAGMVASSTGERPPQLSDALAIDDFVMKHHADPRPLKLIAHCHAGISRSAAVALSFSTRLGVPLSNDMRDTDWANPRLLRLLERAGALNALRQHAPDADAPSTPTPT